MNALTNRKIIQLLNKENNIVALCDDGTMWVNREEENMTSWVRYPDIPVGEEDILVYLHERVRGGTYDTNMFKGLRIHKRFKRLKMCTDNLIRIEEI